MNIFLLIAAMAFVTFLPRAIPAAFIEHMHFNRTMERFLSYLPYTAMAALIFPAVAFVDPERPEIGIVGALVALALAWKRFSVIVVVAAAVLSNVLLYML